MTSFSYVNESSSPLFHVNMYFCDFCGEVLLISRNDYARESVTFAFHGNCPSCRTLLKFSLRKENRRGSEHREFLHPSGRLGFLRRRPHLAAFLDQGLQDVSQPRSTIASLDSSESLKQILQPGEVVFLLGERSHFLTAEYSVDLIACRQDEGPAVLVLDGGNSFDPYLFAQIFSRRRISQEKGLDSVLVSRAFNLYQYTSLVCSVLPRFLEDSKPSLIVLLEPEELYCEEEIGEREAISLFSKTVKKIGETSDRKRLRVIAASRLPKETGRRSRLQTLLKGRARTFNV